MARRHLNDSRSAEGDGGKLQKGGIYVHLWLSQVEV